MAKKREEEKSAPKHAAAIYMKPKFNWLLVAIQEDLQTVDVGTAQDGFNARRGVVNMLGDHPEMAKGFGPHDWNSGKDFVKRLWEAALRDPEFQEYVVNGFFEKVDPKI